MSPDSFTSTTSIRLLALTIAPTLALLAGCRHAEPATLAVEDYIAPQADELLFVIETGDLLSVHIWHRELMTLHVRVRADGIVTLPLVGDVAAAGTTPVALAETLRTRLKGYLVEPVVTVAVDEKRPLTITVLGEVARPGNHSVEPDSGVLQALAVAGGFTEFADRDRILVMRSGKAAVRLRFRYDALNDPTGAAARFRLRAGDIVVVQ